MISSEQLNKFQSRFSLELIKKISQVSISKQFSKGSIIIDIGQDLNYIPLLINGNIKVLREDNEDHELVLYILEEGDTCAMSLTCCMARAKSQIRAVADTDVEVVMIPIQYMKQWFATEPEWQEFILQSYQARFDEMLKTIDTLAFMNMDERLYKYLKDRAKYTESNDIKITHQEIAEDLNTSRVVISRLLKQLENSDKIKLGRNKIVLL